MTGTPLSPPRQTTDSGELQIGPFSPQHILRHPIPPELRAVVLVKDANTRSWQFNLYGLFSTRSTICSPCTQCRAGDDHTTEDGSISDLTGGLGVPSAELKSHTRIAPDEDYEMMEMSRGTSLLLTARERVLSLSEQRARFPIAVVYIDARRLTWASFLRPSSLYCQSWRTRPS